MAELSIVIKFENLNSAIQTTLSKKIIDDLKLAQIDAYSLKQKPKPNDLQLIINQNGSDIIATLIQPNKEPVKYPLTPGRCYSDSLLGIVREAYGLDKHEKAVREILQEFQLRRIGLLD